MTNTSTSAPAVFIPANALETQWVVSAVANLTRSQRRALRSAARNRVPLNQRLRRLWAEVEARAEQSDTAHWLAENDFGIL